MSVWFWDGVLPEGSLCGSSRQGQEAMRADLSGSQRGVAELGSYKSARMASWPWSEDLNNIPRVVSVPRTMPECGCGFIPRLSTRNSRLLDEKNTSIRCVRSPMSAGAMSQCLRAQTTGSGSQRPRHTVGIRHRVLNPQSLATCVYV